MDIKELTTDTEFNCACDLIKRTFNMFEAKDYGKEGCKSFLSYLDEAVCLAQLFPGSFLFIGSYDGKKLKGVCVCKEAHISMLFVDAQFQHMGIGQALLKDADNRIKLQGYKKLTVNSTPIAVEFYRKLGFRALAPQQCRDGIKYIPMEAPAVLHLGKSN